MLPPDRRRLVDKLVRELMRLEQHAIASPTYGRARSNAKRCGGTIAHAPFEARRLGEAPPALALLEVAEHAAEMRGRLVAMLEGHALVPARRLAATLASLRARVVDRCISGEHAYRTALLEQRHAVDVAAMLRDAARTEKLFGLIRWCDDWLAARRTLVSRVAAQLEWFAREPAPRTPVTPPLTDKPRRDEPSGT